MNAFMYFYVKKQKIFRKNFILEMGPSNNS